MMKSEGIHLAGIFFSVLGLWLASAGFIGEKRLSNLETWLRERVSHTEKNFTVNTFLESLVSNSIIMTIFIYIPAIPAAISMVIGVIALLFVLILLIFPSLYSSVEPLIKFMNQDAIGIWSWMDVILGYPLVLILVWTPLVMFLFWFSYYLLKFLTAIFIFPYKFIDKIVTDLNLQSTLIVIGLIFGTVGVIFLS